MKDILVLAGLALGGYLFYEWMENNAALTASASVSTSSSGSMTTVNSNPFSSYNQQRILARAVADTGGNLAYNAFGEILATPSQWTGWVNQVTGMQYNYQQFFPTQAPISFSTYMSAVSSGSSLGGFNSAGKIAVFNAMLR